MNTLETNLMMENDTPIYVNTSQNVKSYTFLTTMQGQRQKQDNEIQRRITAGLTTFARHSDIFSSNIRP